MVSGLINIKIDFLTVIDRPQRGQRVIAHDEVVGKGRKHTTTTAWLNRSYQNIFDGVKTQNFASSLFNPFGVVIFV